MLRIKDKMLLEAAREMQDVQVNGVTVTLPPETREARGSGTFKVLRERTVSPQPHTIKMLLGRRGRQTSPAEGKRRAYVFCNPAPNSTAEQDRRLSSYEHTLLFHRT